jgi:ribosomal protein S18 acetylase RimI-like enzyme
LVRIDEGTWIDYDVRMLKELEYEVKKMVVEVIGQDQKSAEKLIYAGCWKHMADNNISNGITSFYESLTTEKENFALPLKELLQSKLLVLEREKNGKIIGIAGVSKGNLFFIVVKSEYQNRKIGQKLTRGLINLARAKNYHHIALNVFASNIKAIRIYKKFGFKIIFTNFISSRKNYFMILPLDFRGLLYKSLISIFYKWRLHLIIVRLQRIKKRFLYILRKQYSRS